ncbi:glycosyltransferase family 2 protein [Vibrio satsumensis]|uniref:glycosyltransferase family A protein n=1 Tax=Vibrio satsumensis TaxID=2910245 RepID=UPI003D1189E6
MISKLITVFTPTYNRKQKLVDCYNSLKNQSDQQFVWQIIDDGSDDGTEELVSQWQIISDIDIEYYKVPNGGKCRAINKSLSLTTTPLWVCLDSDDVLTENAIDIIAQEYMSIKDDDSICGIFSLRGQDGISSMQGVSIPRDLKQSTQRHIRYNLGIPPEYAHVFKTNIARNFTYPSIEGESYFPLSYVFDQIDEIYKYKVLHKSIMICEYRKDGITKNKRKLIVKNPRGYTMYKKQLVGMAPTKKERYKAVATYITGCILSKSNPFENNDFKILTLLLYPVGLADYLLRYRYQINIDLEIKTKNI